MENIFVPEGFTGTPTHEQVNLVKEALSCDTLKVSALAGSAKTTSLVLLAHNLRVPSLYLAFNKAMAEEAKHKFPHWVEVRTAHSLAFREVGAKYKHKLVRPRGAYKNVLGTGSEIAKSFKLAPMFLDENKSITATAIGYSVRQTVSNFEFSDDEFISEKHVSFAEVKHHLDNKVFDRRAFTSRVLKWANKLWNKRIDLDDDTLITHDTYMKLFQLSKPELGGYDVIYVDEFQDVNPSLLDIFQRQKCKRICVGDGYQSIYQFRKAINALSRLDWNEVKLTKSFRFGQGLADIARGILLDDDMRPHVDIYGFEKKHTEISTVLPSNITNGICYIFRTNSALVDKSIELISQGKKVQVNLDVNDFIFKIKSVDALKNGHIKGVKHPDILVFNSFEEICEEAKLQKGELERIVSMVASNRHWNVLKCLEDYEEVPNPDVVLITAHKSKGLEWDIVVLGDDYDTIKNNDHSGTTEFISEAERNLLYVACTRAKDLLVVNSEVLKVLSLNGLWGEEVEHTMSEEDVNMLHGLNINYEVSRIDSVEDIECVLLSINNKDVAQNLQDYMDIKDLDFDDEDDYTTNIDGTLNLMPKGLEVV